MSIHSAVRIGLLLAGLALLIVVYFKYFHHEKTDFEKKFEKDIIQSVMKNKPIASMSLDQAVELTEKLFTFMPQKEYDAKRMEMLEIIKKHL